MRAKIATLTGEIAPDQLGKIYIHENVLTDPPPSRMRLDPDYKLDSIEKIVAELNLFYAAGGRSLMDCTALDYGRDAKRMLEVARQVQKKRDNNRSQSLPSGDEPSRRRHAPSTNKSQRSLNEDDLLEAIIKLQGSSDAIFGKR